MKMIIQEYDKQMRIYADQMRNDPNNEDLYNKVGRFQMEYMEELLDAYREKAKENKTYNLIVEILDYLIHDSESGNAVVEAVDKELADLTYNILLDELGDYLLDEPEVYKDASCEAWIIDAMFGGNYTPYWDGWYKE